MKKLLLIILTLIMCLTMVCTLSGCNKQIIDLNYKFTRAYVKIGEQWYDLEISSWKDYDGEQLQIKLTNGTIILVSSVNCHLYNGTLPREVTQDGN